MTSNGGLQRRRVGGSAQKMEDHLPEESNSQFSSRSQQDSPNNSPKSAKEFDRLSPTLTLMEEVLLLGLKDKQGYLSFWNDNISYALRGCIMLELALRNRIAVVKDATYSYTRLSDRCVELIDSSLTGEVLLDEAIKLMKATQERLSVSNWIDYMSGETWNLTKVGYQLKQVRERLAKGLVDKGVLRTEKRSFLIFDMATHPVSDAATKNEILKRVTSTLLLTSDNALTTTLLENPDESFKPVLQLRTILLICSAYAANVLENALWNMDLEEREKCFDKVEGFYRMFGVWPVVASAKGYLDNCERAGSSKGSLEVIAAVLDVMSRMDSLL
ncbi:Golgi phospho protein 3 [Basidiobolus meristosporus CBS 931.73]|uniref:Golgi phospho protein 3 n=1 Tax=Basidiobolus meristosporus CBS 931.73 TaxID=1314790 RepID=A0A1Y1Y3C2_9FUNG|nr:Golgi phospho protein 3 [Basidiobolus meristosporus CBS 931.73]|eukprot:ORX92479.1 Golgi phospho protein 3 [Basidiobolus meristosporus CBS 931.73]